MLRCYFPEVAPRGDEWTGLGSLLKVFLCLHSGRRHVVASRGVREAIGRHETRRRGRCCVARGIIALAHALCGPRGATEIDYIGLAHESPSHRLKISNLE